MALWLDRLVVLSVVSPSATVGWMPTVRSKSAFVAPCLGLGVGVGLGLGLGFRVRVEGPHLVHADGLGVATYLLTYRLTY